MSTNQLTEVYDRIDAVVASGSLPVVIFDLDGTLLDNSPRTLRILQEFSAEQGDRFAGLTEAVAGLTSDDLGYDARDALRARGVGGDACLTAFFTFWWARFFTNEYVVTDAATPGARDFTQGCWDRGAHIYYLTGRHVGGMEHGTARSLTDLGFPMWRGRVSLHLKPGFDVPDADFKDSAVADIRSMCGTVVASFENEPGHANLLAESFPSAFGFLVDTGHSASAPPPAPRLIRVADFRL